MKISTAFLFDRATSQMSVVQNRLATSQAQLAQGKQVIAPSDAPDQASTISRLKGILAKHDSYTQALQATRTRFQTEEIALQNVSDGLVRMRELVIQAANDTMGPVDRQALAIEMAGLRDQIMSLANTQDTAGAYIFAGSRVREPAFAMDAQGTLTYQGDETTIDILVGDQRTIESRHAVAQRLLSKVHARINDDATLRDTIKPLDEYGAAETTIALIARKTNTATATDTRHTAACSRAEDGDARHCGC